MNGPSPRRALLWTVALAAAVLLPGRALSTFDGVPLDGRAEAMLVGVVLPALWWIDRRFPARPSARAAIVALLVLKLFSFLALTQHGLCARFSVAAPFGGVSDTVPIEEPAGALRSWDVRADWMSKTPRCTAVLDRPYGSRDEFPIWFVNLLNTIRPGAEPALDISGRMTVDREGTFVPGLGADMVVDGHVGPAQLSAARGDQISVPLAVGAHAIQLHVVTHGGRWRFAPLWNGRDAWSAARLTLSDPSFIDRAAAPVVAGATTAIVVLLVLGWAVTVAKVALSGPIAAWVVIVASAFAALATADRFVRVAGFFLLVSAWIPVPRSRRNETTAFLLVGVPWLALFSAVAWPRIGHITIYSLDDDWHMYQAAAYRIFMNGYWIQGGTPTFYFQPFYRWIVGLLHVLFGDSSVGEVFLDAWCLLAAALLSFAIVKRVWRFRWGVVAAALTLATFTSSAIWYLIGRGLSEIAGTGFMTAAAFFLMRARLGRLGAAVAAGLCAVLMFYTRLNHLLLAACLLAFLLPLRTPADWRALGRAASRVRRSAAAAYSVVVVIGVLLFAAHTWWYAGHFSLLYGTSFGPQQTGWQPSKIGEALAAQLSMREPAAFDLRALPVAAGVVLSALALLQMPYARRLPAALALVTCGTVVGSFVAHTHEYPGRMSVHVVPFAIGVTVCAAAQVMGRRVFPSNG